MIAMYGPVTIWTYGHKVIQSLFYRLLLAPALIHEYGFYMMYLDT